MSDPANKPKKSALPAIIVTVVLILILGVMAYGPVQQQVKAANRTKAIGKGKNLFVALTGFAKDHDDLFPCEKTGNAATAEECFTQLLMVGQVPDEDIFWIKENSVLGATSRSKSNNNGILEPGENSWGYIKGLTNQSKTSTPLIFDSAVEPGIFSTGVWDGGAIVIKLNGSSSITKIDYGGGDPLDENGTPKTGPLMEERGKTWVDIFKNLPEDTKILLPTKP